MEAFAPPKPITSEKTEPELLAIESGERTWWRRLWRLSALCDNLLPPVRPNSAQLFSEMATPAYQPIVSGGGTATDR